MDVLSSVPVSQLVQLFSSGIWTYQWPCTGLVHKVIHLRFVQRPEVVHNRQYCPVSEVFFFNWFGVRSVSFQWRYPSPARKYRRYCPRVRDQGCSYTIEWREPSDLRTIFDWRFIIYAIPSLQRFNQRSGSLGILAIRQSYLLVRVGTRVIGWRHPATAWRVRAPAPQYDRSIIQLPAPSVCVSIENKMNSKACMMRTKMITASRRFCATNFLLIDTGK